jgi:endonuclease-3
MLHNLSPKKVLAAADPLLVKMYGQRPWRRHGDGVEVLVRTILSQSTNEIGGDAAYEKLRRCWPTWDGLADAPPSVVARVIRIGGLARLKAGYICGALRKIRAERGQIDLEFLASLPLEEATGYLRQFDGVGPKTADCVLSFAFHMPTFPVDTHIFLIARRLTVIPRGTSLEQAHEMLTGLIAPARRYAMHKLLIEHGRQLCLARHPHCGRCLLLEICPTGQRHEGISTRKPGVRQLVRRRRRRTVDGEQPGDRAKT